MAVVNQFLVAVACQRWEVWGYYLPACLTTEEVLLAEWEDCVILPEKMKVLISCVIAHYITTVIIQISFLLKNIYSLKSFK